MSYLYIQFISSSMKHITLAISSNFSVLQENKFPETKSNYISKARFRSLANKRYQQSLTSKSKISLSKKEKIQKNEFIPMLRTRGLVSKTEGKVEETTLDLSMIDVQSPIKIEKSIQKIKIGSINLKELVKKNAREGGSICKQVQARVKEQIKVSKVKRVESMKTEQTEVKKTPPFFSPMSVDQLPGVMILPQLSRSLSYKNYGDDDIFATSENISKKSYVVSKKFRLMKQRKEGLLEIPIKEIRHEMQRK